MPSGSSIKSVALEGTGLRSGRPAKVVLRPGRGPTAILIEGMRTPVRAAEALQAERATLLRVGQQTVAMVEHMLAACAGLGLHEGVVAEVFGGELPLLDGAAATYARALQTLGATPSAAPLRVARDAILSHRESQYEFRRGSGVEVAVTICYGDERIAPRAVWMGDRGDFLLRVASARTFAFARELDALASAGYATRVDPRSVVVFAADGVLSAGSPVTPDEPARHKLLDLMGDLFLYGGPPRGTTNALRPGHSATHAIVRRALEEGVLVVDVDRDPT